MAMTNTWVDTPANEKAVETTPKFNLYELHKKNFVAVSQSLQRIQNISAEKADQLAESYISSSYHQAATETSKRRSLITLIGAVGTLGFCVTTINIFSGNIPFTGWSQIGMAISGLAAVYTGTSFTLRSVSNNWNLLRPVDLEEGYTLNPSRIGNKTIHHRAKKTIDALIVKAQRQSPPTP